MDKIIKIGLGIGFDDSELVSYSFTHDDKAIAIYIQMWNGKKVKITFINPILFIDWRSHDLTAFCQLLKFSDLHDRALNKAYENVPENHPYKVYQFLDLDDNPTVEVMCLDYKYEIND